MGGMKLGGLKKKSGRGKLKNTGRPEASKPCGIRGNWSVRKLNRNDIRGGTTGRGGEGNEQEPKENSGREEKVKKVAPKVTGPEANQKKMGSRDATGHKKVCIGPDMTTEKKGTATRHP